MTPCTRRLLRSASLIPVLSAIVFPVAVAFAYEAEWKLVEEHWYVLEIGDRTAGWTHAQVHDDGARYRSSSETILSVQRVGENSTIETRATFIETHAGAPVLMRSERLMSQQPVEVEWRFKETEVIGVFRQGGRETQRALPYPEGTWLTPRAAFRYRLERAVAGADEITFRTIDPASDDLRPSTTRTRRIGEGVFEFEGREIPVTVWKSQTDEIAPLEATEHYTTDGYSVFQKLPLGIGNMVVRRVTKAEALAAKDAAVPELFFESFIEPDRPIENVFQTQRAEMRLRTRMGAMPALPSVGAQRFEMEEGGESARLTINIHDSLPATPEELANTEYRAASPLVDSEDELIRALTRRALRRLDETDRSDDAKRAEALREFVRRHITRKDLDTAFASASETARLRTGDCTEHAVLLAAMLRAADMPARVASGLVYIDEFAQHKDVFGWHMWTQALIGDRWVDLDSTIPIPFHAGYITTSTSSLADGSSSDLSSMLMLIGNLDVEILSAE